MRGERGSALVIAMLVMAIMTLLGVSFLLMADTENKIAENERLSAQALYFGEGVAREVKRWFDRPPYTPEYGGNLSRPTVGVLDRTKRFINTHGTLGPGVDGPAGASTATHPYYKLGRDLDADGNDDIFDKPYRSDAWDMFVGTADGPDVEIDRSANSATLAFLDNLSEAVMPGFPAGSVGVSARVKRIAIYGPPYLEVGVGNWTRYGMATVSVRVQILKHVGTVDGEVLADRTVTAVLNEAPYSGAYGPLHSCDELAWNNAFNVHWGSATASGTGNVPTTTNYGMSLSIPRDLSASPRVDLIHGHLAGDATWGNMRTSLQGKPIEDPWFRFFAGLDVQQWSALGAPQAIPPNATDQDQSNKFQDYPNVSCPEFDYDTWKAIARSGGSDVHYFAWDTGDTFKENGAGTSDSLANSTNGKAGLFFFDTRDGLAPHDFNSGNVALNATPDIEIIDPGYGAKGFLYVNTKKWKVIGSPGRPATFTYPGEPFRDLDENGVKDSADTEWINLRYTDPSLLANINSPVVVDSTDTYGSTGTAGPVWNALGPSSEHPAIVWGILYVTGEFEANGTPNYDGSVITYAGTPEGAKTAGTASFYWDPHLKDNKPPVQWGLPRVIITRWETD